MGEKTGMDREKIMVVEDEWVVADHLCRNLIDLGYTVCLTASTGAEAITIVETDRPDLILMDISLEGAIDGRTAAKEIRKIPGYNNVPIIAITGYALFADKDQFLQEGFNGYLAKPYRKKQLIDIIDQHLNKIE